LFVPELFTIDGREKMCGYGLEKKNYEKMTEQKTIKFTWGAEEVWFYKRKVKTF